MSTIPAPPTFALSSWSLADLFPGHDSPEMKAAFEVLEAYAAAFEGIRGELVPEISAARFLELLGQMEESTRIAYRVYAYSQLWFTENTQNQTAQTFVAQVQQLMANLQNRTLFFNLWWKDLDDENAARLMSISGDFRYWLEEMRNFKPHTLTEPEEKIINIKNLTGANALQTLYDTLTNRYQFKFGVDGQVQELTRGQLMVHAYSPDPAKRARAYQELYRVFGQDGPILGQIYQTLVRDWRNENLDLRHFSTPIAARNLANNIPDQVVETLLDVARQNAPIFQRFFRLKARWLGTEKLRRYDVYAPVVASDKKYPYPEAVDMVLESFEAFSPQVAALARQVFIENHVDSEVRRGKQDGAFCFGVLPGLTPWVQLNYQGDARDVATIAHELGHAIHSMQASDHTVFTFHPSLPLAETASTFAEMLLVDLLLANEQDEQVRTDMLFRQVDDAYATIMRQAFFAMFEREAHKLIYQGASVDELAEAYMKNLHAQFGEALEVGDEFRWEWVSIPHIYSVPFYVYAYAFGQLLVLSLYQQYKAEGAAFEPRYHKILAAGGSAAPADILTEAGIDIYSAAFWQGGFDVIARLVEQLEAIPAP